MKREKIDNYTEPLKESKSHVLRYASTDLTHIRFSFSKYWCVYLLDAAFYDYMVHSYKTKTTTNY